MKMATADCQPRGRYGSHYPDPHGPAPRLVPAGDQWRLSRCSAEPPPGGCRRSIHDTVESDGGFATFAGADADHFLNRGDEDLAIADPAGAGRVDDRLHRAFDDRILTDDLDFHL